MKMQVGIDEAGRGAMLGSLFMAGVKINLNDASFLQDLHIMDSKQFGSNDKAKKKGQKSVKLFNSTLNMI